MINSKLASAVNSLILHNETAAHDMINAITGNFPLSPVKFVIAIVKLRRKMKTTAHRNRALLRDADTQLRLGRLTKNDVAIITKALQQGMLLKVPTR